MTEKHLEISTIMMRYPQIFRKICITSRNRLNKYTLYQYLAKRLIDFHSFTTQILVLTNKDSILKTKDLSNKDINWYKHEEADALAIRHSIRVSKC